MPEIGKVNPVGRASIQHQVEAFLRTQRGIYLKGGLHPHWPIEEAMPNLRQAINRVGLPVIALAFKLLPSYFKFEHTYHECYGVPTLKYIKDDELLDLLKELYVRQGAKEFCKVLRRINSDVLQELENSVLAEFEGRNLKNILAAILERGTETINLLPPRITIYALSSLLRILDQIGREHKKEAIALLREIFAAFWSAYDKDRNDPQKNKGLYANTPELFRDEILAHGGSIAKLGIIKAAFECGIDYWRIYYALWLIGPELLKEIAEIEKDPNRAKPSAKVTLAVKGTVQGVSFRDFCKSLSETIGIAGTAENQADKNLVIVSLEGEEKKVKLFQKVLTPNRQNPFLPKTQKFPTYEYVDIKSVKPA